MLLLSPLLWVKANVVFFFKKKKEERKEVRVIRSIKTIPSLMFFNPDILYVGRCRAARAVRWSRELERERGEKTDAKARKCLKMVGWGRKEMKGS